MTIASYTGLLFQLNDVWGKEISKDIIKREINNGTILKFLSTELDHFDYSLLDENKQIKLIQQLQDLANCDIDYKLCACDNGIALLISYLLELLQRENKIVE